MKNSLIILVFLLNLVALSISISWMYFDWGFDSIITSIGLASSLVIAAIEVTKKYSIIFKTKDLKLAMLGEIGVGKTVYATVLFDEMQRLQSNVFQFAPLGVETIELLTRYVEALYSGKRLPATMPGFVYQYSGILNYNSRPIKKQFLITIGDWAGEHYQKIFQVTPEDDMNWFHQSEYFDYVIHSDIIFLMLDVGELIEKEWREKKISEMIAAVQVFCQKKDSKYRTRIDNPICLLFMKSDVLDISRGEILENSERLIKVCQLRFKNFSYYFVSSIGKGNKFEKPMQLKPENVIEPLLWAIEKM